MDQITAPVVFGQSPPENSILHSTSVSFTGRSPSEPVHIVQYDLTVPVIAVSLTANGQPYTVPSGAAVNIRLAKPDGHYVYDPAYGVSDDGQTAYIAVTGQMTIAAGKTQPVIEVVVSGGTAATGSFTLVIDENPVPDSALQSSDEYLTMQQILAEVQAAAQLVEENQENLQNLTDNLEAVQNAAANAQAAAASAAAAQQAAQEALGFRTFFSAVIPDENGDLDPSRPMTTPAVASVTVKSKGDRIQSVQVNGFTTQAGTGDPSPTNVRTIIVAAQDGSLPITLTGNQTITENLNLTAPLCNGDKVESCVPSGCDKAITIDGSTVAVTASGSNYVVTAADADAGGNVYAEKLAYLSLTAGQIVFPKSSFPPSVTSAQTANTWLRSNPQKVWYQSTAYTEVNDIPVQLETHNSTKLTDDGNLSWRTSAGDSAPGATYVALDVNLNGYPMGVNSQGICSISTRVGNAWTNLLPDGSSFFLQNNGANTSYVARYDKGLDAWTQMLNALREAGTPFEIVYPLVTPAVYAHDPVTLLAVPYAEADETAAKQLANTPSTLPNIDSPDIPMLLDDAADNADTAAQVMSLAANAVPVAGTYVVSSQEGTTVAVSLKPFQDGGDAATVGGYTAQELLSGSGDVDAATLNGQTAQQILQSAESTAQGYTQSYTRSYVQQQMQNVYTKAQTKQIVPYLYKATFGVDGWTSSGSGYTQTVSVTPVNGGPAITAQSVMTSAVTVDDTVQGPAGDELDAAAAIVNGGTKTFGSGTITCVIQGAAPTADAEVFFTASGGGS